MQIALPYDRRTIRVTVPDDATVLRTTYPAPADSAARLVTAALNSPIGAPPLRQAVADRRPGRVVIVVSDVTRPIPYSRFLPSVLQMLLEEGIKREEILILIAAGMHRPSTPAERLEMFGEEIVDQFEIVDHLADSDDLIELPQRTWANNRLRLNRRFVEAGFRLITGLVEPHYMAGFSGGRKAVCPGLASLETVRRFHGYAFLADERATIGRLDDNPCHLEALSAARAVGVDFSLNVVLNDERQVVRAFAGELDAAHRRACEFVRRHADPLVDEHDAVLTSSAGYPLDATFYQSTKSFVCALPAVKPGGTIITVGGCRESIGSREYQEILFRYADDWHAFLRDISTTEEVIKDQWQHQMHTRALAKIGRENIRFVTDGLPQETLDRLSVNGLATDDVSSAVQRLIDEVVAAGKSLCVIPEGPYCAPLPKRSEMKK